MRNSEYEKLLDAVLGIDYRDPAGRRKLQHALGRVKPLEREYKSCRKIGIEIPLETITRLVVYMLAHYEIYVTDFGIRSTDPKSAGIFTASAYTSRLTTTPGGGMDTQSLGTVYGCEVYEMFAKLVVLMYVRIKQGACHELPKA